MKTQTKTPLYLSPSCRVTEIENEGMLCSSITEPANSIMDYIEEDYTGTWS